VAGRITPGTTTQLGEGPFIADCASDRKPLKQAEIKIATLKLEAILFIAKSSSWLQKEPMTTKGGCVANGPDW
jgi:hypothetical protein